jgi:hypothetical protein
MNGWYRPPDQGWVRSREGDCYGRTYVCYNTCCMNYVHRYCTAYSYGVLNYTEGSSKILCKNRFRCGPRHTFSALLSLAMMTHGRPLDSWVNLNEMDYVCMDMQYDSWVDLNLDRALIQDLQLPNDIRNTLYINLRLLGVPRSIVDCVWSWKSCRRDMSFWIIV